jgi:leucyl aminopeptidase
MRVEVRDAPLSEAGAELVAVGLYEGESLPADLAALPGADAVKAKYRKTTLLRPGGAPPVLVIGLGKRADVEPERLRVAAALAAKQAGTLEARSLAWLPPEAGEGAAEALVTGTILAAYRFDRFKGAATEPEPALESLTLLAPPDLATAAEAARVYSEAANRARDLQNTPSNVATPSFLAARAEEIAADSEALSAEMLGLEEIHGKGMGGLLAVSQGSVEEPRLIVLRYSGGGGGPTLGLVGKGVTFDTGGISLKPSQGMQEMKMDMTGAAAVLEAVGAIAELGLALELIAVIPSSENMPSGAAIKPGDVITQFNGKTVEVNNTDAEGRLILADALAYAIELGAERLVDVATLTGAIEVALGSTYAGLMSNDDQLAAALLRAGEESGELVWRMPLHPEYLELMKGSVADLSNLSSKRGKGGALTAGAFLGEFVGETPWAHLDIAGAYLDNGRAYVGNDANGFGVRLLVELARHLAS